MVNTLSSHWSWSAQKWSFSFHIHLLWLRFISPCQRTASNSCKHIPTCQVKEPSHNIKPELNIDLFATRLQSSHPAHTLVIVNKQLHTGIEFALFSLHCNGWSQNLFDCSSQSEKCKKGCRIRFEVAHNRGFLQTFQRLSQKQKRKQYLITWDNYFSKTRVWPLLTSSKRPRPGLVAGESLHQYYSSKTLIYAGTLDCHIHDYLI